MSTGPEIERTLSVLPGTDGRGVVRLANRFDTDPDDLWSALTDPERLARWLGEVEGDLREGGQFRAHWLASGWEGICQVQVCDPPRRLVIHTESSDQPDGVIEVTLTPDRGQTVLVVEDRGVPLDEIAAYGAGDQVHVEDLASYLAGRPRCDARSRWQELHPGFRKLAADLAR